MPDYIELDLIADPDALVAIGFEYMATVIPGYQSRAGNPETVLVEADAMIGAEVIEQVSQVPPTLFAYFGATFMNLPMRDAVPATGVAQVTWAPDTGPQTVLAGWMIAVPNPDGDPVLFVTDIDFDAIEGGGMVVVPITALEGGSFGNGSFGVADPVEVIDGIESIVVPTTGGGADDEDPDAYLDRLADALSILAPRPILAQDHAVLARQVPGVGQTTALDLYQAGTDDAPIASSTLPGGSSSPVLDGAGAYGVERCVTTVITDTDGNPPSTALMQNVYNLLDSQREVNFWVYVIGPSVTTVDIEVTVVAHRGMLAVDVEAAVIGSLTQWMSPGVWGTPTMSAGGSDATWSNDTMVRVYEVIDWANRADGVWYVERDSVKINGSTDDLQLTGAATMPQPGIITVTVRRAEDV